MPPQRPSPPIRRPILRLPGWTPKTRAALEQLIRRGAGQGLPVAFDFDNTLVCGDIGEATLALLVKEQRLKPDAVTTLTPPFRTATGKRVSLQHLPDLTGYYEALLDGSGHSDADPNPLTSGYTWAVEIMAGLSPADIIRATQSVAELAREGEARRLVVTQDETAYPLPWFYPQMVELVTVLVRHEFAVWVVSASNVWSVRWMVLHELNPRLVRRGCKTGIAPDQVIGVAPLLSDRRGHLVKDRVLVKSDAAYAQLEPASLAGLRLTGRLDLPVPVYSGKVACLWDTIGCCPHLAAGDSPGDLPMLAFAENRLWMARIEKPDYMAAMQERRKVSPTGDWFLQSVRVKHEPGFLAEV